MSFFITNGAPRQQYVAGEPVTEQGHYASTSVEFIIDQFTRTGVLRHAEQYEAQYGDFITGEVYELAQTKIAEANTFHASLPEKIRQQFPDVQQFLDFTQDVNNKEEMEALGLPVSHFEGLEDKPVPTPAPAPEMPSEGLTNALNGNAESE